MAVWLCGLEVWRKSGKGLGCGGGGFHVLFHGRAVAPDQLEEGLSGIRNANGQRQDEMKLITRDIHVLE